MNLGQIFDTVFIKKGGKFIKMKPLEFGFNRDGSLKREFTWKDMWKIDVELDAKGFYLFGGIKDKSTFSIRRYHDDISRFSKEDLFKALADNNDVSVSEIRQRFETSRDEFRKIYSHHKDIDVVDQMHEKAWKSNVLAEADRNGIYKSGDLSRVYLLEREGYAKNVIDWNKREQIYHDKSMPLKEGTLGGGEFAIFNDVVN